MSGELSLERDSESNGRSGVRAHAPGPTLASCGLAEYLARVAARVDGAIEAAALGPHHQARLLATVGRFRHQSRENPLADPTALFYLIARTERGGVENAAFDLGAFCHFYLSALDLFDDVQDEDLAGKPHAEVGPAVALNGALVLMFLAFAALERAMRQLQHRGVSTELLELVTRVAVLTCRGQYRDLESGPRLRPADVLEIAREKTASLTLICELAAMYATPDPERRQRYRKIGENMSLFVQVLDDVRDIYGKRTSPDIQQGRPSYPLACFREHATPEALERFERLRGTEPMPTRELRDLLYREGAVREAARALEGFRREIHHEVAELRTRSPWLRMLLFTVDGLASSVYSPKPVAESEPLSSPTSGFHAHVRRHAALVRERVGVHRVPETPAFVAWHHPHWLFDPKGHRIFYADIEGLPQETLPFQALLLAEPELDRVAELMQSQVPAVVAHELFHYYRAATGRMTTDAWKEELAANTLAVAYCREFEPEVFEQTVRLAARVLAKRGDELDARAASILEGLTADEPRTPGAGYELSMTQMALVQMGMLQHLARVAPPLEQALSEWLGV